MIASTFLLPCFLFNMKERFVKQPNYFTHFLPFCLPCPSRQNIYRTIPSKRFLNHLIVSAWVMRWLAPIRDFARLRLATRSPGRVLKKSNPSQSPCLSILTLPHSHLHAAVKVHSVDTNTRVVLDAEIDVLADTEAEVAGLGEVALSQLVFLDLETTLQNLLCLRSSDGDVNGDLFVTTDTEGTDGVTGLACKWTDPNQPRLASIQNFLFPFSNIVGCLL